MERLPLKKLPMKREVNVSISINYVPNLSFQRNLEISVTTLSFSACDFDPYLEVFSAYTAEDTFRDVNVLYELRTRKFHPLVMSNDLSPE